MPNNTFTLTMLGTDTAFTPESNPVKGYPKGETLSVISNLIKTKKDAVRHDNETSQFKADEVEVIKGPFTTGKDVHDRIARGVSAILNAVGRGQTNINLIAHSRGAVESILISHTIDGIQQYLKNHSEATQEDLLKYLTEEQNKNKKNHSNTPDVITELKKHLTNDSKFFSQIKNNMANVSLNLFAIDPVPGDPGLGYTWFDKRYLSIPPIVKKADIILYENERTSWGFTPIYPAASNKDQQIHYTTLPGHHGTGSSGSNQSQQSVNVNPSEDVKSTHVQKLLVVKLIEFLGNNGVVFKEKLDVFDKKRKLGRKHIEFVDQKHNKIDFPRTYRTLYAQIMQHKPAYKAFNKTNYPFLRNLEYRQIIKRFDNKGNHVYEKFEETFPPSLGYVNDDHAKLMQDYFFEKFGLKDTQFSSIDNLVKKAREVLVDAVNNLAENSNNDFIVVDKQNAQNGAKLPHLANSVSKMAPVLKEEAARIDIIKTYAALIKQISQQYLTTDWTSKAQQDVKQKLYSEIKTLFREFTALQQSEKDEVKKFVDQLIAQSLLGIHDTVTQQYHDIQSKINDISSWPDKELNLFFKSVTFQLNGKDDQELNKTIDELFNSDEFKKVKFSSVEDKIKFIYNKLQLNSLISNSPLNEQDGFSKEEYSLEKITHLFNNRFAQKFEDYEKIYNQIQIFLSDVTGLIELNPSFADKLKVFGYDLQVQLDPLIDTAAKRVYSNRPFSKDEELSKDSFAKLVQQRAINHYGEPDPVKQQFEKEVQSLNNKKDAQIQTLIKELNEKQQEISHLNVQHEKSVNSLNIEKEKVIQELTSANTNKDTQIQSLVVQTNEQQKTIINLKQHEETVTSLNKEKEKVIQELTSANNNKDTQIQSLVKQTNEQQHTIINLKKQHEETLTSLNREKEKVIQELTSANNNKDTQIQSLVKQTNEQQHTIINLKKQHEETVTSLNIEKDKTIQELSSENREKNNQIKLLSEQIKDGKEAINDPLEAESLLLIRNKLIPLTEHYLKHLKDTGREEGEKYKAVKSLLECLTKTEKYPKPSTRVKAFYTQLNQCEGQLETHQDPEWKRYVKSAIVIGGILISGILPGLIALAIYANMNERKSTFFWRSEGKNLVNILKAEEPEHIKDEPNDPKNTP